MKLSLVERETILLYNQAEPKMKLDNDTFENTVKSRFFRMTDKQVLY